jgi:hypothetical protein
MLRKTSNRARKTLLAAFIILAMMMGSLPAASAQSDASELFADAFAADALDGDTAPHVKRSRYVSVNTNMLFDTNGKPRTADALSTVTLNLFSDARFTGNVKQVTSDRWGTTWYGRLKNHAGGYFYLTVVEDAFIAHVASPRGVYEVSFAGDGLYKVIEIDQSQFVDHPEDWQFDPPAELLPMDALGDLADSASRIDIMVVYTAAARAAEGSTAAMKARIKLALDETNKSYANAGVTPRLRLVHVRELSYTESGNISTDLNRLAGTSDGYMDDVHSLRNTYGADMVGLIVENGGGYCGIAKAIMASASNAFQVTARDCATGYYSFGHEFGHLQGARHDVYVDPSTTPYAYGHGYVKTGSTTANRWRTVMAYNTKCAALGYNCTRLQYWSNPNKTYNSAAMGDSQAKNYQVLNTTAYTVANFRTQKIANDFNSSFNANASGWSAVKGAWSLYNSAYYRSVGLANTGASAKRNGTYGDLTYEVRMKRTGTCITCANRVIIRGKPGSLFSTNWWKPSYVFQYTNDGNFSVFEATSAGSTVALKGWTSSSAIVKNGWNKLKVVAVGTSLKFYINGTLVWSGSDSSLKTGQVGFGFFRDANSGALLVDWAKLSTTPTSDFNPFEEVAPGVEIPGGSENQSP